MSIIKNLVDHAYDVCIKEKIWPVNLLLVVPPHVNAAVCGELIQKKNTVLLFELVDVENGSLDCAA